MYLRVQPFKRKFMKKNMGVTDVIIRLIIVGVIVGLNFGKVVEGTLGLVLMVLAAIFFLTSIVRFCPIYAIFGIKTCPSK